MPRNVCKQCSQELHRLWQKREREKQEREGKGETTKVNRLAPIYIATIADLVPYCYLMLLEQESADQKDLDTV